MGAGGGGGGGGVRGGGGVGDGSGSGRGKTCRRASHIVAKYHSSRRVVRISLPVPQGAVGARPIPVLKGADMHASSNRGLGYTLQKIASRTSSTHRLWAYVLL